MLIPYIVRTADVLGIVRLIALAGTSGAVSAFGPASSDWLGAVESAAREALEGRIANPAKFLHFSLLTAGLLFQAADFVIISLHMVCASPSRSCCRLSNIFDGCPR